MEHRSVMVRAEWDPEARVFVATSDDVPGLVAEASTVPELTAKLQDLIPELLELNGDASGGSFGEVPLYVMAQQVTKIRVPC
ncbi:DUF1902 domain-containing protein [Roseomonas sp. OT10]|uniref:DUF1902 domain-containing protein n=1 Tax=Roseomonas cutis TaxID=2897332 RepID=UPI001E4BBFBD|nr:DUF1902 domain-containing protein [Roseomonas sp. OT10]UFN48122.1 DUF1902 domain-containing protein [Roseomonas sp. OT10]